MKRQWIRYEHAGVIGFGILADGRVQPHVGDMFGGSDPVGESIAFIDVKLLMPTVPTKVIALWNNFKALGEKLNLAVPEEPLYLLKSPNSWTATGELIVVPVQPGKVVYEGELGIVIGKLCRNVAVGDAARYIFGYTCVNDVTAMDVLFENPDFAQWSRSKSFDTFGCLGPVIATDLDPAAVNLVTRVDGSERQNYPLSDMVFSPGQLVSRISHDLSLLPGDVIACGTSIGVGSIKDGATVEISIDGIGTLRNQLVSGT